MALDKSTEHHKKHGKSHTPKKNDKTNNTTEPKKQTTTNKKENSWLGIAIALIIVILGSYILYTAFTHPTKTQPATITIPAQSNMSNINTSSKIKVWFFYSNECPHCHRVLESGVLDKVRKYANVEMYEQSQPGAVDKLRMVCAHFHIIPGFPTMVIFTKQWQNGIVLQGDTPMINNATTIVEQLRDKLNLTKNKTGVCAKNKSQTATAVKKEPDSEFLLWCKQLHIPRVIQVSSITRLSSDPISQLLYLIPIAAVDSINPCIISILALLFATLLSLKDKNTVIELGVLYVLVVFATYYFIGIALYAVLAVLIKYAAIVAFYVSLLIAIALVITALINIKEIFFYGVGITFSLPDDKKKEIIELAKKASAPAIATLACIVTIVEFPCSGLMYIGVVQTLMMSNPGALWKVALYLVVYNFIFVLPLILMVGAIWWSKGDPLSSLNMFERERIKFRKLVRLVTALVLLGLAWFVLPINIKNAIIGMITHLI